MKKIISLFLVLFLLPTMSFAADVNISGSGTTSSNGVTVQIIPLATVKEREKPITVKRFLETAFTLLAQEEKIPDTYKYISLEFNGVQKGTSLYTALQKGVYMNFIRNEKVQLPLEKAATEEMLADLIRRISWEYLKYTKGRAISINTVENTIHTLYAENDTTTTQDNFSSDVYYPLVQDAFDRLQNDFYDADKVKSTALMQGAIKGIAAATGDKYTVYFPPAESKSFRESLSEGFDGIGAYMDMTADGIAKIVAPMSGSPAEKAGLKGGDIVSKIDDYTVTDKDSITTVTEKIKGVAGTKVKLTIIRGTETFTVEVTREKITVHYVEYKKAANDIALIKISAFGQGVARDFKAAAEKAIKETAGADKLIIDLRNNPGGELDEVAAILASFVPEWQDTVKIKYRSSQSSIAAAKTDLSLMDRKIVILVNGGSASASEIMAGTIKDYMPKTKIIGEKTFGKGSVQNVIPYTDGSSLKYTAAKWFTGKSATGVDGVGIKPDIEILNSTGSTQDLQLEKAIDTLRSW